MESVLAMVPNAGLLAMEQVHRRQLEVLWESLHPNWKRHEDSSATRNVSSVGVGGISAPSGALRSDAYWG
jgi:hypothetical protein